MWGGRAPRGQHRVKQSKAVAKQRDLRTFLTDVSGRSGFICERFLRSSATVSDAGSTLSRSSIFARSQPTGCVNGRRVTETKSRSWIAIDYDDSPWRCAVGGSHARAPANRSLWHCTLHAACTRMTVPDPFFFLPCLSLPLFWRSPGRHACRPFCRGRSGGAPGPHRRAKGSPELQHGRVISVCLKDRSTYSAHSLCACSCLRLPSLTPCATRSCSSRFFARRRLPS